MAKPFLTEDGSLVTYKEYLMTPLWRQKRQEAFTRAGGRCQLCGKEISRAGRWNVHHNNYKNVGCETPADLIVLCIPCHEGFHRQAKKHQWKKQAKKKNPAKPVMLTASERKRRGNRPADFNYRRAGL